MKKRKTWKFHKEISFHDLTSGETFQIRCAVYKIGIYTIINNDPRMQRGLSPAQMVTLERDLRKSEKLGNVENLVFNRQVVITEDEDGFYCER